MLVVGLGNPGKEYEATRHNIGYMVVDEIAKANNVKFKLSKKHQAMVAEIVIKSQKHYLIKPITYMNLSGISVKSFTQYYKIGIEEILIIVDDLDLETGKIRIRPSGSSGGHNGLKSIFQNMATENIARIRIGINKSIKTDTKDYVLSSFSNSEKAKILSTIQCAPNIFDDFISYGINYIMNKYNGVAKNENN